MQSVVNKTVIGFILLIALSGCVDPYEPAGRLRADALVTAGADGCKVSLQIGSQRYEPIGLPDSLAEVGIVLSVDGTVVNRPSVCMIGPGLELAAVSRKP